MSVPPPPKTSLVIDGPAGSLEALLEDPGADGRHFAVVCHPHPLHGGTMHNKVVHTLARALQEQGMPTLRFNYRGVGASAGAYDDGRGETEDALAVIAWGRRRWPGAQLVLAGFSFGAFVASHAIARLHAQRPLAGAVLVGTAASRPEVGKPLTAPARVPPISRPVLQPT